MQSGFHPERLLTCAKCRQFRNQLAHVAFISTTGARTSAGQGINGEREFAEGRLPGDQKRGEIGVRPAPPTATGPTDGEPNVGLAN